MQILIIHTQNRLVAKEIIIRTAIKSGMQYVEMEDEILVEDYLFRIKEKENTVTSSHLFLEKEKDVEFVPFNKTQQIDKNIPQQKKLYLKKQSNFVNEKLKMNQNYNNRRRYK